jgi:hypothetical protein
VVLVLVVFLVVGLLVVLRVVNTVLGREVGRKPSVAPGVVAPLLYLSGLVVVVVELEWNIRKVVVVTLLAVV